MSERWMVNGDWYEWSENGTCRFTGMHDSLCKRCPHIGCVAFENGGWKLLDPRIPALETRVKELEEHIEKHYTGAATGYIKELEGDVCRLEPENKRLREALEKIVTHVEENRGFDSVYKIAAHCGYYARAALEGKEPS